MSKQIRAKEATVQIMEDGRRLGGSMLKIRNFKWNPDAEITKTRYVGEGRQTADLDVKGNDFSFATHKHDHVWFELWNRIQRAEELGNDLPEISLAVTYAYRGAGGGTQTVVLHSELVMKMDDDEIPEDGYLMNSWSGSCQYADAT